MSGITGLLKGHSPGRADNLSRRVRRGTYIVPADVVSALGDGNTTAGAHKIKKVMAKVPKVAYANGGSTHTDHIDIRVSGGEYMIEPEVVEAIGNGDIKAGSDFLDRTIKNVRSIYAAKLSKLPDPK
jgi:hypothetical protein